MRILIFGSGYIGKAFGLELERRGAMWNWGIPPSKDFTFARMVNAIRAWEADLVINCAAYIRNGNADACQDAQAETIMGNTVFASNLANACQSTGAVLLHVSTGCLFQGDNGGKGWTEADPPMLTMDNGAGIYVSSKILGEQAVGQYERTYICRVRLPFDEQDNPRNLLTKLQTYPEIVSERQSLAHRVDFVKACLDLYEVGAAFGIYHCTNPGAVDYVNVCADINVSLYNGKKPFKHVPPCYFDSKYGKTIKSRCVLNTDKLLATGIKIRPVDEAIEDSLRNWRKA